MTVLDNKLNNYITLDELRRAKIVSIVIDDKVIVIKDRGGRISHGKPGQK